MPDGPKPYYRYEQIRRAAETGNSNARGSDFLGGLAFWGLLLGVLAVGAWSIAMHSGKSSGRYLADEGPHL